MTTSAILRVKVCLVGDSGVGKTSLVRRFVIDQFSDDYISTMGTKVTKKLLKLGIPDGREIDINMTIWDIMGEKQIVDVVKECYFHGASGIVAVCDLTREETIESLKEWIGAAEKVVRKVPVILAANKLDLIPPRSINSLSGKLASLTEDDNVNEILTSAKTGENVEIAFRKLALEILKRATKYMESYEPVKEILET